MNDVIREIDDRRVAMISMTCIADAMIDRERASQSMEETNDSMSGIVRKSSDPDLGEARPPNLAFFRKSVDHQVRVLRKDAPF